MAYPELKGSAESPIPQVQAQDEPSRHQTPVTGGLVGPSPPVAQMVPGLRHIDPPPFGSRGTTVTEVTEVTQALSASIEGGMLNAGVHFERTITVPINFCVRSTSGLGNVGVEMTEARASLSASATVGARMNKDYIVVGILGNAESTPKEALMDVRRSDPDSVHLTNAADLFRQIRMGEREVRPFYRRIFSLKRVAAFGLYECFPRGGYHQPVKVDYETQRTLAVMFAEYKSSRGDVGNMWLDWVAKEFNDVPAGSQAGGNLSLQLVLRWSPWKFIFWGLAPIFLSLAVGFWFQFKPWQGWDPEDGDLVAIIQTAWTIASYIVTSAAIALASLAAITQFGEV